MKNLKRENEEMPQATTVEAVERERERERERVYVFNIENRNNHNTRRGETVVRPLTIAGNQYQNCHAISLIALIITIIVIIILAAVVIGSSLSTPEQANFARFSSDFSEIESQVKTTYATEYGKVAMSNQNLTKSQIYQKLAGSSAYSEATNSELRCITFTNVDGKLGNTRITIPSYSQAEDWSINCETGEICYIKGFENNGLKYIQLGGINSEGYANGTIGINIGSNQFTLPKGFAVAKLDNASKVIGTLSTEEILELNQTDLNNGIVILDNEGNEFVWVPCTIDGLNNTVKFSRYKFSASEPVYTERTSSTRDGYDGEYYLFEEDISEEDQTVKNSVKNFGGFYIGRYEAGIDEERTSGQAVTKGPVSKRYMLPYVYIDLWQAIELSNNMYDKSQNCGVKSKLISAYEWDTTCRWIQSIGAKNIMLSESWGNLANSQFSFKGRYMGYWSTTYTPSNDFIEKGKFILIETGADTQEINRHMVNNIYDLAGNAIEYTTEYWRGSNGEWRFQYRGCCANSGVNWGVAELSNLLTMGIRI